MSRIRSIKPGFFTSEDVAAITNYRARLLWIGLWTQCDDHGRFKDNGRLIKAAVFPLDPVALGDVEDDLKLLADQGRIVRYLGEEDGKPYLAVVNWHCHQAIQKPGKPKYPAPPRPVNPTTPGEDGYCSQCSGNSHGALSESSGSATGGLQEDSGNAPVGLSLGRERKGEEGDARAGASPDVTSAPLPITEPPLKCPKHRNDDTSPPCGACADLRKAHDVWVRVQAEAARSKPTPTPATPRCPIHPEHEAGSKACPACTAEAAPAPNLRVLRGPAAAAGA